MKIRVPPPTFVEEITTINQGYHVVAGLDEVGRGPLAGPVLAGAVVFPEWFNALWVNDIRDSKQLTSTQREIFFSRISGAGIPWALGMASHDEVDTYGIVAATRMAMLLAVENLPVKPSFLLVDALPLPQSSIPHRAIVKGDQVSISIAAASIVAKVYRDRIMAEEDTKYPGYDFTFNKGYPTEAHIKHLQRLGPSPIHRLSFAPVRQVIRERMLAMTNSRKLEN